MGHFIYKWDTSFTNGTPHLYKWDTSFMNGMTHLYKWDTSFTNKDIYVSFGTNGTP